MHWFAEEFQDNKESTCVALVLTSISFDPEERVTQWPWHGVPHEHVWCVQKLIMQKAAEDLRNEAKAKAEEKERYINERVTPLKADGLGEGNIM